MVRGWSWSLAGRLAAALPGTASPGSEGDQSFGLSAAEAALAVPDQPPLGAGVALDYHHGVSDAVWLRGAMVGAIVDGDEGASYIGQSMIGLSYALDVL